MTKQQIRGALWSLLIGLGITIFSHGLEILTGLQKNDSINGVAGLGATAINAVHWMK